MKNIVKQNKSLIFFLIIFFIPALLNKNYLTLENMNNIFIQASTVGILSLGQALVIITSGIDLSQGSLVALTSVVVATFMGITNSILFSILGIIFICIILGTINGILISKAKITPFVTTLGMMLIGRGLALAIANGKTVPVKLNNFDLLAHGTIFGFPIPVVILFCSCLILSYFLSFTRTGRHIYAIGGNRNAARLTGINIVKTETLVYILSSFFVCIGGLIYTSRLTAGYCEGAVGYEFDAIAAAVIGGVHLSGGTGRLIDVLMGAIILTIISNFMNLLSISPYAQGAVKGLIILMAVYFDLKGKL